MKTCLSCKHSYPIGEWGDCKGCRLINGGNNISLKVLGEEGKCPYYSEKGINGGWGAK